MTVPYKVLNDCVLVKVDRIPEGKDKTYEGTMIVMAETNKEKETKSQTVGIIADIGPLVCIFDDGSPREAGKHFAVGDKVHFQRYGAICLGAKSKEADHEYWVIKAKDLLVKEV